MRSFLAAAALTLLAVSPIASHDFWLVPDAFQVAANAELGINGQTSSEFPTTLSAVTADRVASAELVRAGSREPILALTTRDNSLRLTHRPAQVGQAVVAVAVHPRSIPESPESFRRYLTLEGAPEALERYEREGILPTDSITRRYAKYAKALVQVGTGGPPAYAELAGHPFEFVPVGDPADARAGDELRFRALLFGDPLTHARVHASVAESITSAAAMAHSEHETDAAGEFTVPISHAGVWNVRALYILPAPAGSGADWDVHWATFVWEAGAP